MEQGLLRIPYGRGNGGTIQITADTVLISGVNAAMREFLIADGGDLRWSNSALLSTSHSNFLGEDATGNAGEYRRSQQEPSK